MPEFDRVAYRVWRRWHLAGDRSNKSVFDAIHEAAREARQPVSLPTYEPRPYPGIWARLADAVAGGLTPGEQRLAGAVQHAQAEPVPLRVIAVVNWRKQRVHGITCDQAQAQEWVREIGDRYGDDHLSASMCVDLVIPGGKREPS